MKFVKAAFVGAVALGITATAALAEYPERPINMVIPYGAGGATDISARTIAEPLGCRCRQAAGDVEHHRGRWCHRIRRRAERQG